MERLVGHLRLLRDLVHLLIPGEDPLVARILEVRDGGLVLTAPHTEGGQLVPAAGRPLEVGFVTEHGARWLAAVSTGAVEAGCPAFGLRFLDQAVRRERRRQPRAKVRFAAEVAVAGDDAPAPATVLDVGDGGLRLAMPLPLSCGDAVRLTVHLPDGPPVRLTATVVRVEDGNVYAFAYGLFAAGSRDRLVEAAFRASALHAA